MDSFMARMARYRGSLVRVKDALGLHARAKEYLHRLSTAGVVRHVGWGWYWIPARYNDPLEFLAMDKGFKVLTRHTAARVWSYGFVKRSTYSLAVTDRSYKRALESFAKLMGWVFEVKYYRSLPFGYIRVGKLFVEELEHSIASCVASWEFLDGLAALYVRRDEVSFEKLRAISRWMRIAKTDVRVWSAIRYACHLFNEELRKKMFRVRKAELENAEVRELLEEAVAKVVELA